jgi:VWFA-related protein
VNYFLGRTRISAAIFLPALCGVVLSGCAHVTSAAPHAFVASAPSVDSLTDPQTPAAPTVEPPATTPQSAPAPTNPAPAQSTTPAPAGAPGAGQTQAPAPADQSSQGPVFTLQVETDEVNQIFTVTDKKGHFITGLRQENFGLLDDGRPPISVKQFTQQTNLPLRVGIMLDTSSSIRQRFQFEQDSAIEFFLQVLHTNDRAFIEGFDVQTDVAQGFTNNIDLLNQGIRKLRPGGGTALFDALYKTCRDEMLTLRETNSVRKALILVSDGEDNYSRAEESDAIKMCQRADTIVYAISTNISATKGKGDDVLKTIAQATGGAPFYPVKIEDVATGFRNIEEELRSQYLLIYRPANFKMDGSFRTIYLHALDQRYQVRTRSGYFAPKPQ